MTPTATVEQAREFRAAHATEVDQLDELTRKALDGGGWDPDVPRLNFAIHSLHHQGVVWAGCPHCAGGAA